MSKALKEIEDFRINKLKELLEQCTEKQQAFFKQLYPMGIENIPDEKIDWAIQQCERTIVKDK